MNSKFLIAILGFFLLVACGKVPETHYFTLEWQQLSEPTAGDAVLLVQRFDATPLLKNDEMMYKTSAYEIKYDNYRRWVMSPGVLLSHKTADYFSGTGLFKQVVVDTPSDAITHVLSGHVTHFEEIDFGGQHNVHISVNFELKDLENKSTVVTTTISKQVDVTGNSAEAIVQAMSTATKSVLDDLNSQIVATMQ